MQVIVTEYAGHRNVFGLRVRYLRVGKQFVVFFDAVRVELFYGISYLFMNLFSSFEK